MFLKSIELFGFKSFADKTRLEFAEGITSLLGPNGCGKSNIVDAIKWVLGEQATKPLRAEHMEDVIFNGTEERKPLHVAEVTLVIDNESALLPVDYTEVEIKRRLFRSGESEYFINRNPVRLKDIRELFFDTGVGKTAYSILEQGKIDQILSQKPEDRRYIFEEAAGITRYKQRILEASRKLERTEEHLGQVETLLTEIKRQYDAKKSQAAKAARYRQLAREQTDLEVNVQLSTVQSLRMLQKARRKELAESQAAYDARTEELAAQTKKIAQLEEELHRQSDMRIAMLNQLQRLEEQQKSKASQLALLRQRQADFAHSNESALDRGAHIETRIQRDEREREEQRDRVHAIKEQLDSLSEELEHTEHEIAESRHALDSQDQEIAMHEKAIGSLQSEEQEHTVQLQNLTDVIVEELEKKIVESGYSLQRRRSCEQALHKQLLLLQEQVSRGNTSDVIKAVQMLADLLAEYEQTIPSFIDDLLAPDGVIQKKRQLDSALEKTRNAMDSHRQEMEKVRSEHKKTREKLDGLRERSTRLQVAISEQTALAASSRSLLENLERSLKEARQSHQEALHDAQSAAVRSKEMEEMIVQLDQQQEQLADEAHSIRGQLDALRTSIEAMGAHVSQERLSLNAQSTQLADLRSSCDKLSVHIEAIGEQINGVYQTFYDTYGKSLKEYDNRLESDLGDVTDLRERLSAIKKQIEGMGYINHMAEEEFAEVKARYDFLHQQWDDLVKAKGDLCHVIEEITKRSEDLFLTCYHKIRLHFQQMFHRLFGGGRAELHLVDPDHVLESGIEIFAQPPGKKLDRLALLSGGEKSLTAVALLFATYAVKPSPFCILDEIDAALDDRNIGNFLNVLKDFSSSSQFIIITHNKRTVLGSQTLLGVTMEEKGVSKAVGYRIGRETETYTAVDGEVDTTLDNTV